MQPVRSRYAASLTLVRPSNADLMLVCLSDNSTRTLRVPILPFSVQCRGRIGFTSSVQSVESWDWTALAARQLLWDLLADSACSSGRDWWTLLDRSSGVRQSLREQHVNSTCRSRSDLADSACRSGSVLAESAKAVQSQLSTDFVAKSELTNNKHLKIY